MSQGQFVWVIWKQIFSTDTPIMVAIFGRDKENEAYNLMIQEQQKDKAYIYRMEKQTFNGKK